MIYTKVDAQAKDALRAEMNSTTDAKWYRRLKVIDLSGQGFSVPELSRMFDLAAGTIRRYIHAYNEAGLDGLQPGYGQGRPLAVTCWRSLRLTSRSWRLALRTGARRCCATIWKPITRSR